MCSNRRSLRRALTDKAYIVADVLSDYLDPDGLAEIDLKSFALLAFPHTRKNVAATKDAIKELESSGIAATVNQGLVYWIAAPALRSVRLDKSSTVKRLRSFKVEMLPTFDLLLSRVKVVDSMSLRRLEPSQKVNRSNTFVLESRSQGPHSDTFVLEPKNQPEQIQSLTEKNVQPMYPHTISRTSSSPTSGADTTTMRLSSEGNVNSQIKPLEAFENRFLNPSAQKDLQAIIEWFAQNFFKSVILEKQSYDLSQSWIKLAAYDLDLAERVINEVCRDIKIWCDKANTTPQTKVQYFKAKVSEALRL